MGLGKKLGAQNNITNQQLSSARTLVSDGGYNQQNIPSLPSAPPMSQTQFTDVVTTGKDAYQETGQYLNTHANKNFNNLQKPIPPQNPDQVKFEINKTIVEKMWSIVVRNELYAFYKQDELQRLVNRACMHDYPVLQKQWNIATMDMTLDLATMGLYDIILFGDDSGSMNTKEPSEDGLTRWQVLQEVVKTLSFWGTLMDENGIVVRFFNSLYEGDCISKPSEAEMMFQGVKPGGSTPLGEKLKEKIIDKIIRPFLMNGQLERPILVVTITDGMPDNESAVTNAIQETKKLCSQSNFGPNAVEFSFAQIGTDQHATEWLNKIDSDPQIGSMIDCTSTFLIEKKQCEAKYGIEFTESTWLVKLLIGAIDPTYDQADEGNVNSNYNQSYQPSYQQSQQAYQQSQQAYQQPPQQGYSNYK
jgi:hypothetical protein